MELSNSLGQLKDNLTSSISPDKKQKLLSFKTDLEGERSKMDEMFKTEAVNKMIEVKILLERARSADSLMQIIIKLYQTLSSEDNEPEINSYISELSEKIGECTTGDSMRDFKNNMTDLKTFLRLIQTNDEEFKFRYSTSPQDGSGQVEFGQAVVNVRGKYQTENIADLITQFVQDSAETLTNHVTPTCPPRADHVVSLPRPPSTVDAQTETEERFLEIESEKKSIIGQGNSEHEHSTASAANVQPASTKDENQGSPASGPKPAKLVTSVRESVQNQLPRQVDYAGKAGRRRGLVIGRGESVEEENRLHYPYGCAYHVERDEILVVDRCNHRIMAYRADGRKARVFYTDVGSPRDVAVSSDGQHVYIAAGDSLIKVNMDGRHVKTIQKFSLGDFKLDLSVVCHREFTVVVDYKHKRVIVFNDRDEEVSCFGREHLIYPVSVAVSEDGRFYVTDGKSSCVKVFEWNGKYSSTFAGLGGDADIWGIAVDGDGNVCVSRLRSDCIDVYSPRRELLTSIGGRGSEPGELKYPSGLCLTQDGRLIVADINNHRVQIF